MRPLREIPEFPAAIRETLEKQFGIVSAEAFYEHATRNAKGVLAALAIDAAQLAALRQLAEGFLSADFIKACSQPPHKHAHGVVVRVRPTIDSVDSAG